MSDFDQDPRVDRLLRQARDAAAGYLDPPGVAGVYATVRQRRRNRMVAIGALTLVLLGGPTVGFALAAASDTAPPTGGTPSSSAPAESPSPSATSSSPTPPASSRPPAPDGRISLADLKKADLDLPPWPDDVTPACRQGDVDFIGQPVYTDVDHDGAEETGVLLRCDVLGEYKEFKVMVFDRDAAGRIVTFGQVLAPDYVQNREGVDIQRVWAIQAAPEGQIRIDVGDYFLCCGTAGDLAQHQWRTYGWDGQKFHQTGGPTAFGPNPHVTDLTVTASDLVMTRGSDGKWHGTLTITVRNAGPVSVRTLVGISGNGVTRLAGTGAGWASGWDIVPNQSAISATRVVGTLAVGASRKLTLGFTSTLPPQGTLSVYTFHQETDHEGYPDKNEDNNRATPTVRAG